MGQGCNMEMLAWLKEINEFWGHEMIYARPWYSGLSIHCWFINIKHGIKVMLKNNYEITLSYFIKHITFKI